MTLEVKLKDPNDKVEFGFDWSDWLNGDTIATSTWTAPTGITSTVTTNNSTSSTIWLDGGTHGHDYLVLNHIVTAGGREKDRSLKIMVRNA